MKRRCKNVKLQNELYEGENKKFLLGASIPYNVIQQQRDVINARLSVVQALVAYTNAQGGARPGAGEDAGREQRPAAGSRGRGGEQTVGTGGGAAGRGAVGRSMRTRLARQP